VSQNIRFFCWVIACACCAAEQKRLLAAGAHVGRSCAALTGPTPEGEKGIGKLRVWAKNGLGGLRIGRAIGDAHFHCRSPSVLHECGELLVPYSLMGECFSSRCVPLTKRCGGDWTVRGASPPCEASDVTLQRGQAGFGDRWPLGCYETREGSSFMLEAGAVSSNTATVQHGLFCPGMFIWREAP
jgi:hypothetical protein